MTSDSRFVVTEALAGGECGAIVWWDLSGQMDLLDVRETMEAAGLAHQVHAPTLVEVLPRALKRYSTGRRIVRPVVGRSWELVSETVTYDANERPTLRHQPIIRAWIDRDLEEPCCCALVPGHEALVESIMRDLQVLRGVLTHDDASWHLRRWARECDAVSLRPAGGCYFVPQHRLAEWRKIVEVMRAVSNHRMSELPALRSESAVETLLGSVRAEARQMFDEMEQYLAGDTTTRGLNGLEARLAAQTEKVARYAALLGAALPDLDQQAERLTGALQAARFAHDQQS